MSLVYSGIQWYASAEEAMQACTSTTCATTDSFTKQEGLLLLAHLGYDLFLPSAVPNETLHEPHKKAEFWFPLFLHFS